MAYSLAFELDLPYREICSVTEKLQDFLFRAHSKK